MEAQHSASIHVYQHCHCDVALFFVGVEYDLNKLLLSRSNKRDVLSTAQSLHYGSLIIFLIMTCNAPCMVV